MLGLSWIIGRRQRLAEESRRPSEDADGGSPGEASGEDGEVQP